MAPICLSGMTAIELNNIIKDPNIAIDYPYGETDADVIKNNIISQFVNAVGSENVITNNMPDAVFNTDSINGYFSFRYENTTTDIPVFSAYTSKPKKIYFLYSYTNRRNVMTRFELRFKSVRDDSVKYAICSAHDPYYDASRSYAYYDNNKKTWFTISGFRTYSGEFNISDVATQLPNCFLEDEKDYIMEIHCYNRYAGYATNPFYIKDFKIEF